MVVTRLGLTREGQKKAVTIKLCHHEAREKLLIAVIRRAYICGLRVVAHKQLIKRAASAQLEGESECEGSQAG